MTPVRTHIVKTFTTSIKLTEMTSKYSSICTEISKNKTELLLRILIIIWTLSRTSTQLFAQQVILSTFAFSSAYLFAVTLNELSTWFRSIWKITPLWYKTFS